MAARYIDINIQIVERCRLGDRKAQCEVYHLYARQMYNVCMRIVNHTEDAEDVLQEAFMEAYRYIHEYRAEASFGAWLKKIVVNRAINHVKKRRLTLLEHLPESVEPDENSTDNEALIPEIKKVHAAIMELPTGYRLVLSLYLLEGYDHAEIGQILGVTEATSKSQYNRAKNKLRALLKRDGNEG